MTNYKNSKRDSRQSIDSRLNFEVAKIARGLRYRLEKCNVSPESLVAQRVISKQPLKMMLSQAPKMVVSTMVSMEKSLGCSLYFHFQPSKPENRAFYLSIPSAHHRHLARTFGEFFASSLKNKDVQELTELSGLSASTVRNLKGGSRTPRLQTIFKMARALGYETYLLVCEDPLI